ncbi:hypothetical protein [Desulfuromonas sp. TF]|uniref:hypothetical protein n=1 Tax=Desulfuromonas sp. TF TaxID=1232410 RepID=UPI001D0419FA|nr:hypothetical protein [Desulfuromonas sp. TF]
MALVSCPECEREVSDKANACPGCGYPLNNSEPKVKNKSKPRKLEKPIKECSSCEFKFTGNELTDMICPSCGIVNPIKSNDGSKNNTESTSQGSLPNQEDSIETISFVNTNRDTDINTPKIPKGLYIWTAVLGFPLGTGGAIGMYIRQKLLLEKGELSKLSREIKMAKIACYVLLVPSMLALLWIMYVLRIVM